jgi:uncharacterized protein (DUF2384 family)
MEPVEPPEPIRRLLADVYRPDGQAIWLNAPNQLLDGAVPADLIRDGEGQRVADLLTALAEGVIF